MGKYHKISILKNYLWNIKRNKKKNVDLQKLNTNSIIKQKTKIEKDLFSWITLFLLGQLQRNAESLGTADLLLNIESRGSTSTTSPTGSGYNALRILAVLHVGIDNGYRRLIESLIGWFFLFFFFEAIWWAWLQ